MNWKCPHCGNYHEIPDINRCPFCEKELSAMTDDYAKRHVISCARDYVQQNPTLRQSVAMSLGEFVGGFVGGFVERLMARHR